MKFVTDGAWGTGLHRLLNPDEIDQNIYDLFAQITSLVTNPAAPLQIVGIRLVNGTQLFFDFDDGSSIGPIYIPVQAFHWRDEWTPTTSYQTLDVFKVTGVGLYFVLLNHVSGATFDKTILDGSGNPELLEMFAFAPAANVVYDFGFRYPGVLALFPSTIPYIYEEPLVRKILLPVDPGGNAEHQAYMDVAPSSVNQIFNVFSNDSIIGNVEFAVGNNFGAITVDADTTFFISNRVAVGRQTDDDPVAAGLSIMFAGQQIVGS